MANSIVNVNFKVRQMGGAASGVPVDLNTDTLKVMLVNATYAALTDATKQGHEFISSVAPNEVAGAGYTAGGVALAGVTIAGDAATGKATIDANDVSIPNATITASGAVIYKDTGTPTSSPIVGYFDFGGAVSSTSAAFDIAWPANGIFDY